MFFFDFLEVPQGVGGGGGAGYHHFMHYKIRVPWVPPDSRRGMYIPTESRKTKPNMVAWIHCMRLPA